MYCARIAHIANSASGTSWTLAKILEDCISAAIPFGGVANDRVELRKIRFEAVFESASADIEALDLNALGDER